MALTRGGLACASSTASSNSVSLVSRPWGPDTLVLQIQLRRRQPLALGQRGEGYALALLGTALFHRRRRVRVSSTAVGRGRVQICKPAQDVLA